MEKMMSVRRGIAFHLGHPPACVREAGRPKISLGSFRGGGGIAREPSPTVAAGEQRRTQPPPPPIIWPRRKQAGAGEGKLASGTIRGAARQLARARGRFAFGLWQATRRSCRAKDRAFVWAGHRKTVLTGLGYYCFFLFPTSDSFCFPFYLRPHSRFQDRQR